MSKENKKEEENIIVSHKKVNTVNEIPEVYEQYSDGVITMEEMFNKLLDIMARNVGILEQEILKTNPTIQILKRVL